MLIFNREHFFEFANTLPHFLTYTLNFAIAFGWCALPPYGVAWSLCIEEQFYLCWPWMLRKFGARRCLGIALALVTIVLAHRCFLFMRSNAGHLTAPSQRSIAFTTGSTINGCGWRAATVGFTFIALATALFVIALFLQLRLWPARILSCSPLVAVGRISQEVITIVAVWTLSVGVA